MHGLQLRPFRILFTHTPNTHKKTLHNHFAKQIDAQFNFFKAYLNWLHDFLVQIFLLFSFTFHPSNQTHQLVIWIRIFHFDLTFVAVILSSYHTHNKFNYYAISLREMNKSLHTHRHTREHTFSLIYIDLDCYMLFQLIIVSNKNNWQQISFGMVQ